MESSNDTVGAREQVDVVRRVLLRRWWLIALGGLVCAVSAFVTTKLMSPVYETTTTVRILKEPALTNTDSSQSIRGEQMLRAEAAWFKSRQVLEAAARRLGLGDTLPNSPLGVATLKLKQGVKRVLGRPQDENRLYAVVERLQNKALSVKELTGSSTLEIRVTWDEPHMAMQIANTAVDVFIEQFQEFNRGRAQQNRAFLEQQVQLIERRLEESEREFVAFQKETGILSPDEGEMGGTSQDDLDDLLMEKRQLELLLASSLVEREHLDRRSDESGSEGGNAALRAALRDPNSLVRTLMNQLVASEAKAAAATGRYTDEHLAAAPEAREQAAVERRLREELKHLGIGEEVSLNDLFSMAQEEEENKNVAAQLRAEREGVDVRVTSYEEQLAKLTTEIEEAKQETAQLPDELQEYLSLARERRVDEELYTMLNQRLAAAQIDEKTGLYDVRVFDPAQLPLKPIRPKPLLITLVGAFMGLALGVSLALVLEYLDDSFRSAEEVETYLRLPVLAELPRVKVSGKLPLEDSRKTAGHN